MGARLGGRDIDVMFGDLMIHFITMSASIEDNKAVVKTKGVPNGKVGGEVGCTGEVEIDTATLKLIIAEAKKAGSFEEMPDFDIVTNGEVDQDSLNLEMFGCMLKISDLLNADSKGGEVLKHKIGFEVTSPDFVRIDGVPYLSRKSTENIR